MVKVMEDRLPQLNVDRFICPHCSTFAQQCWTSKLGTHLEFDDTLDNLYRDYKSYLWSRSQLRAGSQQNTVEPFVNWIRQTGQQSKFLARDHLDFFGSGFSFARCVSCGKFSLWLNSEMIYPASTPLPDPNDDLNDAANNIYLEARKIFRDSPRASAALLRLCLEEILEQVGETRDLNTGISNLVQKGLSQNIQQAWDYCRVIGNKAVHSGEINLSEDKEKVKILFNLVNDIAQEMITKPKEMKERYGSLPETSIEQINKRDRDKNNLTDE